MSRLVLDASVALAWCFEDESNPASETVLESLRSREAVVPCVWPLEIANVLVLAQRKGRLIAARAAQFTAFLRELPIAVEHQGAEKVWSEVLSVAQTYDLTAYDAAYLDLAIREGGPLATLNVTLQAAARAAGVPAA